ncbi:MAG: LytR family transcriptional regulator [Ruminococcaceae bacterium]|nr:LytR family transcriptional regulator [Oscillospiraceae bacterium]
MKKTNKRRLLLKVCALVLVVIFLISAVFYGLEIWEKHRFAFSEDESLISQDTLEYDGKTFKKKENIETFLVLGLDTIGETYSIDSYTNDKQSDFVVLFVFDNDKKICNAVQINRDTIAEINVLGVAGDKVGTVNKQIALAHTYGNGKEVSCRNVANAVSKLMLGVNVNHYVSFTMDAVSVATDFIGGVEVTVLDDFTGISSELVKGETVNLNGELALTYVRSRQGLEDSSNKSRMNRHTQFIKAFYDKFSQKVKDDKQFAVNAYLSISSYVVSDCNSAKLEGLLKKSADYSIGEIYKLEGTEEIKDNLVEFYPSEESIKEAVINLFYNEK